MADDVEQRDPVAACGHADVDVHPEVVLVAGDAAVPFDDLPVQRRVGAVVPVPGAVGVQPRGDDVEPLGGRRHGDLEPQAPQLTSELGRRATDCGSDLDCRLLQLGPDLGTPVRVDHVPGAAAQLARHMVHELVLLLDPDGEIVLHSRAPAPY